MYFSLDSGLATGGSLVVDLSALPATAITGFCNLYLVGDTLDAEDFVALDVMAGTVSASG